MLLSVGSSVFTRVPGVIGVIWFLPLLHSGLGTAAYAELLSAMALALAVTCLARGLAVAGRRVIGEAWSRQNHADAADGVASLVLAQAVALALSLFVVSLHAWMYGVSATLFIVTALTCFGGFLNQFNDVQAAHNEHYVTASIMFVVQASVYAAGILVPAARHSVLLAALVIQGPYWFTSLAIFGVLLWKRPYLFRGRPGIASVWSLLRQGTLITTADGLLIMTLSLLVVWLQDTASAATAAWFATLVRLFQTLLTPVVMLLMPLSGYLRLQWDRKSPAEQMAMMRVTALCGTGYGTIVGLALLFASSLYVNDMLHLPTPPLPQVLPVFFLFGAIVAYSSFSSMAYVLIPESTRMSGLVTTIATAAIAIGWLTSLVLEPLSVVSIYALVTGLPLLAIVFHFSGFGPTRAVAA